MRDRVLPLKRDRFISDRAFEQHIEFVHNINRALDALTPQAPVDAEYLMARTDPVLTKDRAIINSPTVGWDFSDPNLAQANVVARFQDEQPGAVLYAGADDFNLDTTPSKLVNYGGGGTWKDALGELTIDLAAGEITANVSGLYHFTLLVTGLQGSNTQNESILLNIATASGSSVADVFDVATNQTDARALGASFTRFVDASGGPVTFWAEVEATANLGNFSVIETTLEMVLVAFPSVFNEV